MLLSVIWTKSAIPTMSKVAKETHCSSRLYYDYRSGVDNPVYENVEY